MLIFYILLIVAVGMATYLVGRTTQRGRERSFWIDVCKDLAHQLGTPLSALMGWMEILPTVKDQESALREMNLNLDRLKDVTERLSQVGSPSRFELVSLKEIIADVSVYFRKRLPASEPGIAIEQRVTDDPKARINRRLFEWALEELIRITAETLSPGGGTITLSANVEGENVVLDVIGKARDVEPELSGKTHNAVSLKAQKVQKKGLAVAKYIIEKGHRGRLLIKEDSVEKETTMQIVLKTSIDIGTTNGHE